MLSNQLSTLNSQMSATIAMPQSIEDKFESQEKEIDYLKKNALAQEIKINDLSKIVDMLFLCGNADPQFGGSSWQEGHMNQAKRQGQAAVDNVKDEISVYKDYVNKFIETRNIILASNVSQIKDMRERKAAEIVRLQVEAQEKLKAQELAEKKEKAMKDMMARVTLLEETAKKEEDELENLKLVSEPKTDEEIEDEDPKIQELLMREANALAREANALARAAEMRAEKAKLRGTQKSTTKSSTDPSTWSKEKAEKISQMWVE